MYELNTVAIVRYCRQKNAAPKLGFLSPHIKQDYEVLYVQCMNLIVTEKFPYGSVSKDPYCSYGALTPLSTPM